jgi:hypothetical protein
MVIAKVKSCLPGKSTRTGICPPDLRRLRSIGQIVAAYKASHRLGANEEVDAFSKLSLSQAVELAGGGNLSTGARHPHHRRRTKLCLSKAKRALAKASLSRCASIDELLINVDRAIRHIHGIGDLFVYDAALSIGASRGFEPERVYLHAGARKGARALGLGRGRDSVDVRELPREFRQLRPHEIEDCLCIFKDQLQELQRRGGRN